MKKTRSISTCPTGRETLSGLFYLAFQFLVLPGFLFWCNGQMAGSLNDAELNFVFYMVNFMAILLIFHDYLGRSAKYAMQHPADFCQAVILGFVAYYACRYVTTELIRILVPSYTNYNDAAMAEMCRGNAFLMFIGTVVLVPPFEECIYRGVIFRNLYGKSHWAAYLVSMLVFAVIHIIGYIGQYSALELLMALLQYLPAGLCLAWSYIKGGSVFVPILIHAAINFITIRGLI